MEKRSRALWITVGLLGVAVAVYVMQFGEVGVVDASRKGVANKGGAAKPAVRRARKPTSREAVVETEQQQLFSTAARRRRQLVFSQVRGDEAFERLGAPQPGEWLYSFKERGQTHDDYTRTRYNRRTAARRVLHIQPYNGLSAGQRALLPVLREYAGLFFDVPVKILRSRRLNRAWYSRLRGQYDAERIADHLSRHVPDDSLGVIGMAGTDLYALGLNFVFGVGLFHRRAGIYSLHRFGTEKLSLLRRTLQLATHELGHMFSLQHCVFYKCLLNGTNSLAESDRQPLHLCPVCLTKLHHNLRFDPRRRYERLAEFYRRHGLVAEAEFASARAREVAGAKQR